MLGELIIIYQISWANHTKYGCIENKCKYNVFQVSIKEGDEEKVDEMRGREKLVRTPQQVIVVFLFYFFYICMLVYLYLGCISMAFVFLLNSIVVLIPICRGTTKGLDVSCLCICIVFL